ncbi:MAG: riboflavin kinase, archaea type [Thermoplasmata archaeon]|nr:riboflavin kinase, archaea type [Thermoplasmata archaeon]
MTRPSDVEALKQLALLGALDDAVELASGDFAALLGLSQQTASRRLIELTDAGLVTREMGIRRQRIRITEPGRELLRAEHLVYRRLFEAQDRVTLAGHVKGGLGEGRYYLSRPGYVSQFEARLGWVPYPGTLNLELSGAEANKLRYLRRNPVHTIEGFQAEGRTFGGVTCHPATVGELACATILPHRSHYTTTLELIAPVRLRDALPCKDGDRLEVTVHLGAP